MSFVVGSEIQGRMMLVEEQPSGKYMLSYQAHGAVREVKGNSTYDGV